MLLAQSSYGKIRANADDGPISMGRYLFPTVPEDKFDRALPQERGLLLASDVRIDNRAELSADLGIHPSTISRSSDSAILFRALLRWGDEAADRIVGEFAFAFWDSARERLLLARDIMALRPLYFHRGGNFFAFASMPSGLHALSEIPYEVNYQYLAEQLALLPQVGRDTYFREIERVEPGHLVSVERSGVNSRTFWRPPIQVHRRSPTECEEGLRDVLSKAVKAQSRTLGEELATHLSSGLDSSVVTATAAMVNAPRRIVAFTAVPREGFDGPIPPGAHANEGPLAALAAEMYPNVEHVLVGSAGRSPIRGLEQDCAFYQQPPANLCNMVWFNAIYEAAKSRGLKTLLMASGGNLTFSYAGAELLPQLLRRGKLLKLAKLWRALIANGNSIRSVAALTFGPFTPSFAWKAALRMRRLPTTLPTYSAVNPALIPGLEARAAERGLDFLYRPRKDPTEYRLWVSSRNDGGNSIKAVLARWGISVRDPTFDKRVIEYCLSLPDEEFVRGGIYRSLGRRAFSDRIPPEILNNKTWGYQAADWYEALGSDLQSVSDLVRSVEESPRSAAVIDADWIRETLDTWPSGDWDRYDISLRYRAGLLRSASAAHFIRKVEGANR